VCGVSSLWISVNGDMVTPCRQLSAKRFRRFVIPRHVKNFEAKHASSPQIDQANLAQRSHNCQICSFAFLVSPTAGMGMRKVYSSAECECGISANTIAAEADSGPSPVKVRFGSKAAVTHHLN